MLSSLCSVSYSCEMAYSARLRMCNLYGTTKGQNAIHTQRKGRRWASDTRLLDAPNVARRSIRL
jgi:hypothetical protein